MNPILFVCIVCGKNPDPEVSQQGGAKLIEQMQVLHHESDLEEKFTIKPVKCMGVCNHPCAVAFVTPGKPTYLFGDLPSDDAQLSTTASTLLNVMNQYCNHADGALPYRERPELLKDTIIAKIPTC
jgi:predicted metal-binding protein